MRTSPQPHNREAIFGSRYIPLRNQFGLICAGATQRRLVLGWPLFTWPLLFREQADLVVHFLESQDDSLQSLRCSFDSLVYLAWTFLLPRDRFRYCG